MSKFISIIKVPLLCGLFMWVLSSCSSNKEIAYFQTLSDSVKMMTQSAFYEPKIQPDDIISVSIQTIDPSSTASVNQVASTPLSGVSASGGGGGSSQSSGGFLVDKNGEIEMPMLGKIKVAGLSTSDAREFVREKAAVYYKMPSVQVRFLNYKITLIGEVAKPGTYLLPNEKVTLLDALGLAGDLTIYGKRQNILLIRENGEEKQFVKLDITTADIFKSPYYYLKQNDVIYVEPNRNKIASSDAGRTRYITIAVSVITAAVLAATRLR